MAKSWGFLARLLQDICDEIGAELTVHDDFGRFGTIRYAGGTTARFKGTAFDINPLGAYKIADDKDYTATLLKSVGLNAAEGRVVVSPDYRAKLASYSQAVADAWDPFEDAKQAFRTFGFPLFLKPNIGSEGIGVRKVLDEGSALQHLKTLYQRCDTVLIQPPAAGRDYRLVMLDGEMLLAYERRPLSITGDGKSSVVTLVQRTRESLSASGRYLNITALAPFIEEAVLGAGLSMGDVPDAGRNIALLSNANLSTGGSAVDVTDRVAPKFVEVASRAMDVLGLRYAGLDILAGDIEHYDDAHTILEANPSPGLQNFYATAPDRQQDIRQIYRKVLLAMACSCQPE